MHINKQTSHEVSVINKRYIIKETNVRSLVGYVAKGIALCLENVTRLRSASINAIVQRISDERSMSLSTDDDEVSSESSLHFRMDGGLGFCWASVQILKSSIIHLELYVQNDFANGVVVAKRIVRFATNNWDWRITLLSSTPTRAGRGQRG